MVLAESDVLTRDRVPDQLKWDLSGIFASEDNFSQALEQVDSLVNDVLAYQGRLGESAATLASALAASSALQHLVERLIVYSRLSYDVDTTADASQSRLDAATGVAIRANQTLAWFDPELLAVSDDRLTGFLADQILEPWQHSIDDIVRNRPYTRTSEIEAILSAVSDVSRTARDAFGALDNADLTYGQVRDEQGSLVELTKGRYGLLEESRDRAVRQNTYEVFVAAYEKHKHTLAALHAGNVRNSVFFARARNFPSARFGALNANAISEDVYDTLIDVTRARIDIQGRYLELRRRLLDVPHLEIWDSWVPLSKLPPVTYSWEEAIVLVCEGLHALGDEYVTTMREGLTSARWVDVHETKGKRSGAYSWGAYGSPPKILMNWNGTLSDVFTLAHEAGHAMHSYLANQAQPFQSAGYPIFLAEIASTLNEVLLTWHILGTLAPEATMERFAILNRFADQIAGTHVRQTMFAEFERETHRITESNQPLVLQKLNDLYAGLYQSYSPGMNLGETGRIGWSRIPHFYTAFYVYQYATGISAAIALAKAVRDEGQPAVDRVMELFRSGGKDYPLRLLERAGVDLTNPDAIDASMDVFDETVSEMEAIVDSGAFAAN